MFQRNLHRAAPYSSYDLDPYSSPSWSLSSPLPPTSSWRTPSLEMSLPASYDAYDSHRSQLEHQLLARKQRERREVEAAAYLARQRQLERQAAIEQAIQDERDRRFQLEQALWYRDEVARRFRQQEEQERREYAEARRAVQQLEASSYKPFHGQTRQPQLDTRAHYPIDANDLFKLLLGARSGDVVNAEDASPRQAPQTRRERTPLCPQPREVQTSDLLRLLFGAPSSPTTTTPSTSATPAPTPASVPAPAEASRSPPSTQVSPISPSSGVQLTPVSTNKTEEVQTSDDEAAVTVQRQFRRHLARRNALARISTLASSLSDRQSSFEKPDTFVFREPTTDVGIDSTAESTPAPALAYGSANASFLAYEDFLVNLLSEIDAVESGGDRQVKKERKALVRSVDRELARLDAMRQRAWEERKLNLRNIPETTNEKADTATKEAEREVATPPLAPGLVDHNLQTPSTAADPGVHVPSAATAAEISLAADVDDLEPLLSDSLDTPREQPPSPRLTEEALSSLARPIRSPSEDAEDRNAPSRDLSPSSTTTTRPPASESGSSTTSSTLTLSTEEGGDLSPMSDLIAEVLRRAEKLGEKVERLEALESKDTTTTPKMIKRDRLETNGEEEFIVV